MAFPITPPTGRVPAAIPGAGAMPPSSPASLTLDAPGTYEVAALAVPAGKQLTVHLWGGGGGGGGSDAPAVGDGGASGGYLKLTVPAALWALGGSLVVAIGGPGTSADEPANPAPATTLTLDGVLRGSAAGGDGGAGADQPTAPGAPGTNVTGAGVTVLLDDDGAAGTARVGGVPGTGGVNPTNGAHGSGADAHDPTGGTGPDGEPGAAVIQWS